LSDSVSRVTFSIASQTPVRCDTKPSWAKAVRGKEREGEEKAIARTSSAQSLAAGAFASEARRRSKSACALPIAPEGPMHLKKTRPRGASTMAPRSR